MQAASSRCSCSNSPRQVTATRTPVLSYCRYATPHPRGDPLSNSNQGGFPCSTVHHGLAACIQGGFPCSTSTKGGSLVQPQPRGVPLLYLNQGGFPFSTSTKGGSLVTCSASTSGQRDSFVIQFNTDVPARLRIGFPPQREGS